MRRIVLVLCFAGCTLAIPSGAFAGRFDLQAPPPGRPAEDRAAPRPDGKISPRPEEHQRVPQSLGFVGPLTTRTESGRAGAAGWTTPDVPVVPGESAGARGGGLFGMGFAAEWGHQGGNGKTGTD